MGNLAIHLRQQFFRHCPPGWQSDQEVKVLSTQFSRLLGYAPQVDVLLEREVGGGRLWIAFVIDGDDPVANHAHFATAHLFEPQAPDDAFLSMLSPLVAGGRRNLAANTVLAMRRLGMTAYQTSLLPHHTPAEIGRLDALSRTALLREPLDIGGEIGRALRVTQPALESPAGPIYFAANVMEVLLNVYRWNLDLQTDAGRACWGQHTVTSFVYDPRFRHFAPAGFAAYVPGSVDGAGVQGGLPAGMPVAAYAQVTELEALVAARRARHHLVHTLAMPLVTARAAPELQEQFGRWLALCQGAVQVHPAGPELLLPPPWF